MTDELSSPAFRILREDIAAMRLEMNTALRDLVTREVFTDERKRVDDKIKAVEGEQANLRTAISVEAGARVQAEHNALNAQIATQNEQVKVKRQTQWQWFALACSLFATPVIGALIGAAFSQIGP